MATVDSILSRCVADENGCWLWQGCLNVRWHYGYVSHHGRSHRVHRLLWELVKGPVPKGLVLDHLCRVRHCVNPCHLEPVTPGENIRRGLGGRPRMACRRGHPLDGNSYYNTFRGKLRRVCKTCHAARVEAYRARRATA